MSQSFISTYALPVVLAIIMFGMGSSLEAEDFKRIAKHPKQILTGLAGQMLLLPAIAFALAAVSSLPPQAKAGLVLIAACPGGTSSNLVTYLLKGKLALSISMTAVNSLLILFSVPLIVRLGLVLFVGEETQISLPFNETVLKVFLTTLLPVGIGLVFRRKFRNTAEWLQHIFKWLLPGLLAAAFAAVLLVDNGKSNFSWQDFRQLFPYALGLNVGGMLTAYILARLLLQNPKSWYTIAIEVGLQNSGLALFVASSLLNSQKIALIAIVYGSFSFFTTALAGWLLKKHSPREEQKADNKEKA